MQFPAVLRGLLVLFNLFLDDILSRSQISIPPHPPPHPHYFYANLDKLWDPYFQKVGVRTLKPPWIPQ